MNDSPLLPFLTRRRLVCRLALLLCLLLSSLPPANAAARRLTHDMTEDAAPQVNSRGQVVWSADGAIYFWDGATARPIGSGQAPQISETGHVAWQGFDRGEYVLLLWDGRSVRELVRYRFGRLVWQMNEVGQIAWQATVGQSSEIFLWDGASTRWLTNNTVNDVNPKINRAGQVVWNTDRQVFLYDGRSVRLLNTKSDPNYYDRMPQINDAGWVVWRGREEQNRIRGLSLWDGSTVREIDTPDGYVHQLHLSNAGTITFTSEHENRRQALYVWDGQSARLLAEQFDRYQPNRRGQVVWQQNTDQIFLWDGTTTRFLSNTGGTFVYDVNPQLNDRGEVVWIGQPGGFRTYAVYRWKDGEVQLISRTLEDEEPGVGLKRELRISNGGHVVWIGEVAYAGPELFLYTPPAPGSIELVPPIVIGGRPVMGRVTLPEPAPAGGALVALASENRAAVVVPSMVVVPAGQIAAVFPVTTFPVRPSTTAGVTASYGGQTWRAELQLLRVGMDLAGGITRITTDRRRDQTPRLNDAGQVAWQSNGQIFIWTGPPIPTILPLSRDRTGDFPPQLNERGQVLWESGSITERALFFWDGRTVQQIDATGKGFPRSSPQLNDRGEILWEQWKEYKRTLLLRRGDQVRQLGRRTDGGASPDLNNLGHAVWHQWDVDDSEIYYWDGVTVRAFTRNRLQDSSPQLNDAGQIVWLQSDGQETEIMLWDGRVVRQLSDNEIKDEAPRINALGWVTWQSEGRIYLWDGTRVQWLNRDSSPGSSPEINDAGQVVWTGSEGPRRQVFLWSGSAVRQLTGGNRDSYDPQINNAGQVVWETGDTNDSDIFLYTPPLDLQISASPLIAGRTATGTITLAEPAPVEGAVVLLTSRNRDVLTVPDQVTVPGGATSVTFPITVANVSAPARVPILAVVDEVGRPAMVTVLPVGLTLTPGRVLGGDPATGTVVLPEPAAAGGVRVRLASEGPAARVPESVTVPAGEQLVQFEAATVPVAAATDVRLTAAAAGEVWAATLRVLAPPVFSLELDPPVLTGGLSGSGIVTLTSAAPAGGTRVTMASDNGAAVPESVLVPAGETRASFPITTRAVESPTTVRITASSGEGLETAPLRIVPIRLATATLETETLVGPASRELALTLSGPAPREGAVVTLTSSHPDLVRLPESVDVYPGGTARSVTIQIGGVQAPTEVVITAAFGGTTRQVPLRVLPARIESLNLTPNPVSGGIRVHGVLKLSNYPVAGAAVTLTSDNPAVASVPAQAALQHYSTELTFPITTQLPATRTEVRITASYGGQQQTATLIVHRAALTTFTIEPVLVQAGTTATGTVTLSAPAPEGGILVTLRPESLPRGTTVPDQVLVPAGETRATFTITTAPVDAPHSTTIHASFGGVTKAHGILITAVGPRSFTVQPEAVVGGGSATGTVVLDFPAPAGGRVVTLQSSRPAVASVPASVTVPEGAASVSFPVATQPVLSAMSVTLTASAVQQSRSVMLRVLPAGVAALTLDPARVAGGGASIGTVTLSGPAPAGGGMVKLVSSAPEAVIVHETLTVPAGKTTASFPIATRTVSAPRTVRVTATYGEISQTAALEVVTSP